MPRRVILYVLLALAVPLPALALTGGDDPAEPTSIQVAASLDGCGTAGANLVCEISASWSEVPGATRYTASVTSIDGSVVDLGEVGGGSGTFSVPYVGNGTYTVTVLAYGTPPGADEPEVIAKGSSDGGGDRQQTRSESFSAGDSRGTSTGTQPDGEEQVPDGEEQVPDGEEPPSTEPEVPDCEEPIEPPVAEAPPEDPGAGGDPGPTSGAEAVSSQSPAALTDDDCPEPEPAP